MGGRKCQRQPSGPSAARRPPRGRPRHGLVLFASILLLVVGFFNMIYGIAAIANSPVFTAGAHYVIGDLRAWGWITLIIAVDVAALYGLCAYGSRPGATASTSEPQPRSFSSASAFATW
jgi:hypothetical protein